MGGNGTKEKEETRPTGMATRVRMPTIEQDIISAAHGIEAVLAACNIADEESVNNAALYLAQLQMFHLENEIDQALYKLIGTKSIKMSSIKYAVQANGKLFWDTDASKQDKEILAKMQKQGKKDEEESEAERR